MKILQLNVVYKKGSTGYIVHNIHTIAHKTGIESYISYGRSNYHKKNHIKIGNNLDIFFHVLGTRIFDKHGLYSKKATEDFINKIEPLNIDIFHLHNIHGYYLHYPTLFEYLKDKKLIWTLHDCWAFTGHCSHYDYIGCDKWQTHCENCPQKRHYPASLLLDNSYKNFELKKRYFTSLKDLTIVTPSNWLANEVKKSFLNKYKIKVIHNGIDLNIFRPISSDFRKRHNIEDKFIILGVANIWEERKGFDYFIRLSKMINNDEKIVLVGLSNRQLKLLPKNIIGIKRTSNLEELVEIYSSSDVFLNPSLEDNFPTTNIESLACGTPVVTFDTGGSPECIDQKTGIVVSKEDLNGLYKAIQKIKILGKEKFSSACRQRAENLFDSNRNYQKYIDLYKGE